MKLRFQKRSIRALTIIEVLVVIAILVVLAALLLPVLAASKRRSARIGCVSNLKQIEVDLASHIWEGENTHIYPMALSITNGGAMELIATGNVAGVFRVMSNELSTPKILICPDDSDHVFATNFDNDFNNSRLSYFIGPDADELHPQRIMTGDDNLEINGTPVNPGVLSFSTNAPIAWAPGRHYLVTRIPYLRIPIRHNFVGNFGYADGSVSMLSDLELHPVLIETDMATNRLAIP